MTWIKICGITNLEDALTAMNAGADALGFVFYEKSPRYVDPKVAREIVASLPSQNEKIGVFFKSSAEEVRNVALRSGMTGIQVSGDVGTIPEKANWLQCFEQLAKEKPEIKVIPALSMRGSRPEAPAMMWDSESVYAFLLDSGFGGQPGGTGRAFDWGASEAATKVIKRLGRVIVAGGLAPSNIAEAMRILKPWGVDVSSGVEAAPGKKDPDKVKAFVAAVRNADLEVQELQIPRLSRSSE
ncbi:MAG: phosphoribosylanthranilate isomerase [Terriglobales bacterium]